MDWITNPEIWASFFALTALEIVLGVDNVIFISLLVSSLRPELQKGARQLGLFLALVFRVGFLLSIAWLAGLTETVYEAFGRAFSWRDIILFVGGLFLLVKATLEIHSSLESGTGGKPHGSSIYLLAVLQIVLIDLVFSIDSVVTAVGMAQHVPVMVAAITVSIAVMYIASEPVAHFIQRHPTTKMLALSFLLLVGVALVADAWHFHIPRGYLYFAMAFAVGVEALNLLMRGAGRAIGPRH